MSNLNNTQLNGFGNRDTKKQEGDMLTSLESSLQNVKEKVSHVTHDMGDKALKTVKDYPIHTALAAAGVGFVIGAIIARK